MTTGQLPNLEEVLDQVVGGEEPEGEEATPDLLAEQPDRDQIITAIKDLAKYVIGLDKWVRRQEVVEARRQRFFWRGDQYLYWKSDAVGFVPAQGGQSVSVEGTEYEVPRYTDVYNIFTGYGESLMSPLTQNPPGINWQAEDPNKPEDIKSAQTAEKYRQKIERDNDRKLLQTEIARLFYTDGRTVLHTTRVGELEVIKPYGVLETKCVPITAKCREDLIALVISTELDKYKAKEDFPDQADKIKEGSSSLGESAYERIARLGVLQGTKLLSQAGDSFSHLVTRHIVFIRPGVFDHASDEMKPRLKELYPAGIKVTFCGDEYCGSSSISMDDEIAIGFPTPGDGMSRPSLGKRMIPLQEVFNDELNLWHEAHDYCIPTLFMYNETGDISAMNEQISQPGNIIPFSELPPNANAASSAFYAAVLEAVPETLPKFIEFVQGPLAQFVTGAFPALFGGDTGDNDTFRGIAMQRDQAMGRMGLPWMSIQYLFAEAYRQAVNSALENDPEDAEFSYAMGNEQGAEKVPLSVIRGGKFKALPDTDSSFPETTSAKRGTFQTLMTTAERNPAVAEIMAQPKNQALGHQWMGLGELVIPSEEANTKQMIEIAELLKQKPIPPTPMELQQVAPQLIPMMAVWEKASALAVANNQPPPPSPIPPELMKTSVPVDEEFDFHAYELQCVQDWLSSSERRKQEDAGNLTGILNVRLHGLAHKAALLKQQMQQAMMQQGAAPPPKIGKEAAKGKLAPPDTTATKTQAQPAPLAQ